MSFHTNEYLKMAGKKNHRSQVTISAGHCCIDKYNWNKHFPLKLKLFFRWWLELGGSLLFYHSTVTCTLTFNAPVTSLTCIFCLPVSKTKTYTVSSPKLRPELYLSCCKEMLFPRSFEWERLSFKVLVKFSRS